MSGSVGEIFGRHAQIYDRSRRQLIPCFDDFYAAAIKPLKGDREPPAQILDLGAGTGLLSLFVSQEFPKARLTLMDASEEMLGLARERFAGEPGRFIFLKRDYGVDPLEGPYDAVVSALSIHHLTDETKAALFRKIFLALKPGGAFVNADQVMGADEAEEARFRASWLREVKANGVSEADLAAAKQRMKADKMAPLAAQLKWLKQAGFVGISRNFQKESFAVYSGFKPA